MEYGFERLTLLPDPRAKTYSKPGLGDPLFSAGMGNLSPPAFFSAGAPHPPWGADKMKSDPGTEGQVFSELWSLELRGNKSTKMSLILSLGNSHTAHTQIKTSLGLKD